MYHVSALGIDERMVNAHYYYYDDFNVSIMIIYWTLTCTSTWSLLYSCCLYCYHTFVISFPMHTHLGNPFKKHLLSPCEGLLWSQGRILMRELCWTGPGWWRQEAWLRHIWNEWRCQCWGWERGIPECQRLQSDRYEHIPFPECQRLQSDRY